VSDKVEDLSGGAASPTGNGKIIDRKVVRLEATLPKELESFFADPPLAGNENREEYDTLFAALAAATKPKDVIVWLFVRDIADLSWEIRRERALKLQVIKSAEIDQVRRLLSPQDSVFELSGLFDAKTEEKAKKAKKAKLWASDSNARARIDKQLEGEGYDPSDIFPAALNQVADRIEAIDRRIASYELRRMTALRAIAHYSETLARRLEAASSDVIEGEFTEAAE
jgi:hypothetical protein